MSKSFFNIPLILLPIYYFLFDNIIGKLSNKYTSFHSQSLQIHEKKFDLIDKNTHVNILM